MNTKGKEPCSCEHLHAIFRKCSAPIKLVQCRGANKKKKKERELAHKSCCFIVIAAFLPKGGS